VDIVMEEVVVVSSKRKDINELTGLLVN
jgi:hypothetical protein